MPLPIAFPEFGDLLLQLIIAAARTALLAGVAGLLLKTFGVNVASVRLHTWKAVLFAGLVMPLLAWWVPAIPIPIPGLPSHAAPASMHVASTGSVQPNSASSSLSVERNRMQLTPRLRVGLGQVSDSQQHSSATTESSPSRITVIAWLTYLSFATLLLSRLWIGLIVSQRLLRTATPIHDPRIATLLLPGNRAVPFCESASVSVPVTLGAFTPTILLPLAWREWDQAKLHSVLCHELSHARRHDGLAKLASLLHRGIFWFSPLAWWLDRHLSELAEEVSDEAALSAGAERNQYARNLLGFFNITYSAAGRVRWQGVSMAISGDPERRLEKILAWTGDTKMKAKKWIVALAIALGIPAAYLIAAARPVQNEQPAQAVTSEQEQSNPPAAPDSKGAPALPAAPSMPSASAMSAAPAAPAAPVAPVASAAEVEDGPRNRHNGFFYSYGDDDDQRFVIVSGKSDSFTMSGTGEDARHVEKLKKQISGDFIWFQRDEKSYIIRDSATVERARRLWAPQEELGKKQEELGKQQEALGKQQEELGARMQAVRVKVPDISGELDKLKAELKQLGPDASMEQVGRIQSEIGELQSRIGEIQSHAGDEQGKIGEEMGALGEQQGKLGAQQGELGRQQGELAEKANREMKKLLDDAIKNGSAKPETDQSSGESI